jgi:hypothetical protein
VLGDIGRLARRLGPAEKKLETTEEAHLLRALGIVA